MDVGFWKQLAVELVAEAVLLVIGLTIASLRIIRWWIKQSVESQGRNKWDHICNWIWSRFQESFLNASDDDARQDLVDKFSLEAQCKRYAR